MFTKCYWLSNEQGGYLIFNKTSGVLANTSKTRHSKYKWYCDLTPLEFDKMALVAIKVKWPLCTINISPAQPPHPLVLSRPVLGILARVIYGLIIIITHYHANKLVVAVRCALIGFRHTKCNITILKNYTAHAIKRIFNTCPKYTY